MMMYDLINDIEGLMDAPRREPTCWDCEHAHMSPHFKEIYCDVEQAFFIDMEPVERLGLECFEWRS